MDPTKPDGPEEEDLRGARPERVIDLRDEAAIPPEIVFETIGPTALPHEIRIAAREGAVPRDTLENLRQVWPWIWVLPHADIRRIQRLLTEFPAHVLVLPPEPDSAPLADAARGVASSIRILAATEPAVEVRRAPEWAALAIPSDAAPPLWVLAVLALRAVPEGSARWGWVQTLLGVVDSAHRGLRGGGPPERGHVAGSFELVLRLALDEADRSLEGFAGRSFRVAELSRRIAEAMQLPSREVEAARLAGLFHDLGMHLVTSPDILGRPGPLGEDEWSLVRSHPGASMVAAAPLGNPSAGVAILDHHERLDGSGYPRGKRGDAVTPATRVVAVADAFEAMTHPRPHRAALGSGEAVEALRTQVTEGRLDRAAVESLATLNR
ncbi:MAG: HD-GYP domain-containing protein [Actinomycetota bacterium]